MHGAVFGTLIVVVALVVIAGFAASPVAAVIVAIVGAAAFAALWGLRAMRDSGKAVPGPGPGGVPSTRDSSYDPVQQP